MTTYLIIPAQLRVINAHELCQIQLYFSTQNAVDPLVQQDRIEAS